MSGNDKEISMSIEETNRLRAELGLKPLKVGPALQRKTEKEEERRRKREESAKEKKEAAGEKLPSLTERVAAAREARRAASESVKTLGEGDDKELSAADWVKRQRKKAKRAAAAAAKRGADAATDSNAKKRARTESGAKARTSKYTSDDLEGLRINHSLATMRAGETMTLTLADRGILDGSDSEENVLEVAELAEEERRRRQKLKNEAWKYDATKESRGILAKYDDEDALLEAEGESLLVLGKRGMVTERQNETPMDIDDDEGAVTKMSGAAKSAAQLYDLTNIEVPKLADEYYRRDEMATFKKKDKKKKKKRRTRERDASGADLATELLRAKEESGVHAHTSTTTTAARAGGAVLRVHVSDEAEAEAEAEAGAAADDRDAVDAARLVKQRQKRRREEQKRKEDAYASAIEKARNKTELRRLVDEAEAETRRKREAEAEARKKEEEERARKAREREERAERRKAKAARKAARAKRAKEREEARAERKRRREAGDELSSSESRDDDKESESSEMSDSVDSERADGDADERLEAGKDSAAAAAAADVEADADGAGAKKSASMEMSEEERDDGSEERDALFSSLHRARQERVKALRAKENDVVARVARARAERDAAERLVEADAEDQGRVFSDTTQFVQRIDAALVRDDADAARAKAGADAKASSDKEAAEAAADDDDGKQDETEHLTEDRLNSVVSNVLYENTQTLAASKGIAGALRLLKKRGGEHAMREEVVVGRATDKRENLEEANRAYDKLVPLADAVKGDAEKRKKSGESGRGRERDRDRDRDRDRRRRGVYLDEEKDWNFKLKLDHYDEQGRIVTAKQAFRVMSHNFHGIKPGKSKQERYMRKYEEQLRVKGADATDTPLHMMDSLRKAQSKTGKAGIVMEGLAQTSSTSIGVPRAPQRNYNASFGR